MALSTKTFNVLVDALASKPSALALQAAVVGRFALDAKNQVVLSDAMTSKLKAKEKTKSAVDEVIAAIVSGAPLTLGTKRKLLTMMAGATSGNELINFIQTVATPSIKL